MTCQGKDLVYSPYQDKCVSADNFPCGSAYGSNPCVGKKAGLYAIPDVMSYLHCYDDGQTWSYGSCKWKDSQQLDEIFDNCTKKCIKYDMNTFCKCRALENFRDPLDCHDFLSCTGHDKPLKRDCQHSWLVYDPYYDKCVTKNKFDCFVYSANSGKKSPIKCILESEKLTLDIP